MTGDQSAGGAATVTGFEFLLPGRVMPFFTACTWPEPGVRTPKVESGGRYMEVWYGTDAEGLLHWGLVGELWAAEFEGVDRFDQVEFAGRRGRLVRRLDIPAWAEVRLFAADCAERVVPLTGPDDRCVHAVEVARKAAGAAAVVI